MDIFVLSFRWFWSWHNISNLICIKNSLSYTLELYWWCFLNLFWLLLFRFIHEFCRHKSLFLFLSKLLAINLFGHGILLWLQICFFIDIIIDLSPCSLHLLISSHASINFVLNLTVLVDGRWCREKESHNKCFHIFNLIDKN